MRILIVVPPERFDFYNYLIALEEHELVLLWHVKQSESRFKVEELPLKFKSEIFWGDYRTPKQLLNKLKPDRIIFFEIIDLRQIALIVTAKRLGIFTCYLEHGAAGDKNTAIERWSETDFKKDTLPYLINRFRKSFMDVIKAKWFYFSVTRRFKSFQSYFKYFKLPFLMLKGVPNKVLAHCKFSERVPDKAIVFSKKNYTQFELYTGISMSDAVLTGVPFFDKYFAEEVKEEDHIVYIDHPYLEEKLFIWTKEHHQKIANSIFEFAELNRVKVYIKLHPRSDSKIWNQYSYNKNYVEILQQGDFTDLYIKSKLILGFSSSLLTGFLCAKKNVVLLGWHPEPRVVGADYSKTGLCHYSDSVSDLSEKYEYWVANNLAIDNEELYQNYLKEFNYPFDGKATERVIRAITRDEVY